MNSIRAAIYARVSSEQQAAAHTIESQLIALTERAQADGPTSGTDSSGLHSASVGPAGRRLAPRESPKPWSAGTAPASVSIDAGDPGHSAGDQRSPRRFAF
jgi:hypothetical protein